MAPARLPVPPAAAPGCAEAPDRKALIREVGHAAGNLFHRMRYCASVLEDQGLPPIGAEALGQLQLSLDAMQRLVGRTIELFRPVEARPVAFAVDDLVRSIALRFGVADDQALTGTAGGETEIDPSLLDRVLSGLAEVFVATAAVRAHVETLEGSTASAVVSLSLRSRAFVHTDPHAAVHVDLGLALACKLLSESGCDCRVIGESEPLTVELSFPLVATCRAPKSRASRSIESNLV